MTSCVGMQAASLVNPSALPKCEKYFREQGYDFKFSNGRLVLVRKTKRHARRRRQGEVRRAGLQHDYSTDSVITRITINVLSSPINAPHS